MSKKITSLFNFKKLQKFSSALMLPIAILPAAGLILAIGISFNIELLANCGGLIFANLPLLFCVGIVIGLTGDGSSSLFSDYQLHDHECHDGNATWHYRGVRCSQ